MIKHYKLTDTLLKTDYDDIVDKLDKILKSTVLEEGKTVFFDKNVQTSRNEFKKQYPTNKIVHDLSKADYYISNNKPYPSYYFGYGAQVKASITLNNGWKHENNLKELNEAIDLVNNVGAKFIYPSNIKFKSANSDLPEEMVDKITQMLKSKDQETFQLGWTILFEYDHELCRDKFLVIISKADNMSYYRRKRTRVIEQKLKTIKSFYSNKIF
jgi:hypothetical protein